jgi:hypothetical protein
MTAAGDKSKARQVKMVAFAFMAAPSSGFS